MEYYTEHNRYRPKTPSGTGKIAIYSETVNKNGKTILKKTGEEDLYKKIQASLDETKVYNILEQFLQSGDTTVLNRRQGIYANLTEMPKNEIEMLNLIKRAEHEFNALDKDVRAEFENDVGVFKQSIIDGSFETRMNKYVKKKQEKAQPQQTTQQTQQEQKPQGVNLSE